MNAESKIQQRYLIVPIDGDVFYSNWFEPENNWSDNLLCVIDTHTGKHYNGLEWVEIEEDNL